MYISIYMVSYFCQVTKPMSLVPFIPGGVFLKRDSGKNPNPQSGQALVEFALTLPILLFLLLGILSVGFWMNAQQVATQAARLGAQQLALSNSNTAAQTAAFSQMQSIDVHAGQVGSRSSVVINPASESDLGRKRGNIVSVSVTYTLPFVSFPLLGSDTNDLVAQFRQVQGVAVVRMECAPERIPGVTGNVCPSLGN